ncbi:YbaB/EbfC family nucleoid-associated protein [Candidatus Nucleicultrix amoebiphila]|jgi:DNA-binding YbaB/EbfC family protein|uniref:Nucleoid-associated protein GQ61_04260 n=1 Tax=Candidatus Nucleicultrix amoebiphila FS5 TaxID=1414854 RepID=A0A1W6N471_9PROT|nr:YbaB/EbfC family nucleoid-associated protein [Candidatus Nucleicultrix amoebiphila]ARN84653.1 hypothetical protein GQ61_04260 [Candidatus Nucleicultrix amoebiphila FS5]
MKNIGNIMKQVQQMQAKMTEVQEKLGSMTVDGSAGGGMISVVVNGKGELKSLKINPELLTGEDKEMLEDLIVAAVNDGKAKAEAMASDEMSKVTGGMGLPGGMKLPF